MYIESITPVERRFYWNYYIDEAKKEHESSGPQVITPLSDNAPRKINAPPGLLNI